MPAHVSNLRRRGRWQGWVWGVIVTGVVVSLQHAGVLDFAERYSFDKRVQHCQFFNRSRPSQVVVMLVDKSTLDQMGSWPWPRAMLGEVIAEIDRCGARTIGLDVLLSEPTSDDDALAAIIARCGNVVLPLEIDLAQPRDDAIFLRSVRSMLVTNPELWPHEIAQALRGENESTTNTLIENVKLIYDDCLNDALLDRINPQIAADKTDDEIYRTILPKAHAEGGRSQLTRKFDKLVRRARATAAARAKLPPAVNLPPLLKGDATEQFSIERVLAAAKSIGFVDYKVAPGGKLRTVPLLADFDARAIPQFALAVACAQLNTDPGNTDQFRVSDDRIELRPANGRPIDIPIRTEPTAGRKLMAGTLFEVPMRGTEDDPWGMFDDPPVRGAPRHVIPVSRVADVVTRSETLRQNNLKIDSAIRFFLRFTDVDELARFDALRLPPDDFAERRTWLRKVIDDRFLIERDAEYRELRPDEMDDQGKQFIEHFHNLAAKASINDGLLVEIESTRRELESHLKDRAVIFGFAASGRMDQVSTALHDSLPGAMVHGAIVHAILGGEMWRKAPLWQNLSITALLGLLATWAVSRTGQYRAHVAALSLLLVYALINGFILFDLGNYILSLAYPVIAIAAVWGIVTARRALIEALDRAKVESEFRTYVDPALVDYVLTNKTGGRIRAQRREMSIVYVDLEGFTRGAEQLKSRAARVVNFYMNLMVKVIRANGGYVNKFLGDGIMFFFNAPRENPQHAQCAVRTVLEIQSALQREMSGRQRRRTGFKVRAGISTGVVTVGDAGSSDASDYTVLGDIANLGARLESANRQFETACIVTERTVELCNGEFLMRPLGRFRVVGRQEPVDVFEPMSTMNQALENQRAIAEATASMVYEFKLRNFAACSQAIDRLELLDGSTKLTALYRRECTQHSTNPPAENWCGVIDLAEK